MTDKPRMPFFDRLKASLEEGIAHAKGDMILKTVEVSESSPKIDAKPPTSDDAK